MTRLHAPVLLCLVCAPLASWGDPLPPKVCVVVQGDAEPELRAFAESVSDAVAHAEGLRGVADGDIRAALRGDTATPEQADRATLRRALRGTDADGEPLDRLGEPLGCGYTVELGARPQGVTARVWNGLQHRASESQTLSSLDASQVVQMVRGEIARPAAQRPPAPRAPAPAQSSRPFTRVWPWLVVGGVAAGVALAFYLASQDPGSHTTITVVHNGAP